MDGAIVAEFAAALGRSDPVITESAVLSEKGREY